MSGPAVEPAAWRAWCYLVWLSFQRQARAHLMVWIALALLAVMVFLVGVFTQSGRWTMAHYRWPSFKGPTFAAHFQQVTAVEAVLWPADAAAVAQMHRAAVGTALYDGSGFFVFSNWVVFQVFATFLFPLWSLSFATEALGREREADNLLWVLTRPLSRPAIFLAKFVGMLPWCLMLNLGGFALICLAGGRPGRLALALYWPAVFWGTLAFAALFHLLGALLRRAAVVALLYTFFLETIMGNLPGHFKRLSLSFYTRCLMFDRAHDYGIRPERPTVYLPVDGTTAWLALAGVTVVCLVVGAALFTRNEELDVG